MKTGTVLPALCSTGDMFFNSAASAGQNLYGCTGTNLWSPQAGGGGSGITQLTGDVTAGPGSGSVAASVVRIGAVPLCTGFAPTNGQVLQYTTGSSPNPCYTAATQSGGGGDTITSPNGTLTVSGTSSNTTLDVVKIPPNVTLTGTPTSGQVPTATSGIAATWQTPSGGALPAQTGVLSYLQSNGSVASWGNITTGGSGALDCATVPGQCDLVTAIVPFKASANTWTGANDFSASPFMAIPTGTPATSSSTCSRGSIEYDSSYLYVCIANNSWKRLALASF